LRHGICVFTNINAGDKLLHLYAALTRGNGPGVESSPHIIGGMRHDVADDLAWRPLVDYLGEQSIAAGHLGALPYRHAALSP